ncbi:hypothetical protein J5N97_027830 [Dioscorea zingiberensis]|uniref:Uncharacterized protein n=1 Tax=Dioscorea zingiberensis TaxID=325984 RepID=A0A9D5BXU6_9LILI|nr:hypothetical protein J5N97_027830 [Dioscorea zingiberensis]
MVMSAEMTSRPPDPSPAPRLARMLHNSSFPVLKTWGAQRLLRCANVNGKGEIISPAPRFTADGQPRSRIGPKAEEGSEEEGDRDLEEMREKLMVHVREAAGRMELAGEREEPEATRPWSLRPRRSVARVSLAAERDLTPPPPARFSLTLSKQEIAEDVYAITGSLPRRRPRKRARAAQKKLDALFPGGWLSEITLDSYKVPE